MARPLIRTLDQLRARCEVIPEAGCWIWMGAVRDDGYGAVSGDYPTRTAHRLAKMLAGADVPARMHVCHRCDTPLCVNPNHLFVGTAFDNMADMTRKGRRRTGINWTSRDRCENGHAYLPGSYFVDVRHNARICRHCRALADGRHRARNGLARLFQFVDNHTGETIDVYARTEDRALRSLCHRFYRAEIASAEIVAALASQIVDAAARH